MRTRGKVRDCAVVRGVLGRSFGLPVGLLAHVLLLLCHATPPTVAGAGDGVRPGPSSEETASQVGGGPGSSFGRLFQEPVVLGGLDGTVRGLIWLVNGCSISTSTYVLAKELFDHFTTPDVCAVAHGEAWNYHDAVMWPNMANASSGAERAAVNAARAPFSVIDTVIRTSAELETQKPRKFPRDGCRPFVVAKATTSNYAGTIATDFDSAPPPFLFVSMVRSNRLEFAACLVRDRMLHGLEGEMGDLGVEDIGYLVDASTGLRVPDLSAETATSASADGGDGFRAGKEDHRAVLNATRLPALLDRIDAADYALKTRILREMDAPMLVYETDDLVDFTGSPTALRRSAETWASILARAHVYVSPGDVATFLAEYAEERQWGNFACDLSARIHNIDEVRYALKDSPWFANAFCPGEPGRPGRVRQPRARV